MALVTRALPHHCAEPPWEPVDHTGEQADRAITSRIEVRFASKGAIIRDKANPPDWKISAERPFVMRQPRYIR
jgi:hypothetical protein